MSGIKKRLLSPRDLKMNSASNETKPTRSRKAGNIVTNDIYIFFNIVITAIRKDSPNTYFCIFLSVQCLFEHDKNHLKLFNFLLLPWMRQRARSFLLLLVLPHSWLLTPRGSPHSLALTTFSHNCFQGHVLLYELHQIL